MRLGDAGYAMRRRRWSFDAWEGNGRTATFPEMLLISGLWNHNVPRCSPIMVGSFQLFLTSHLVLTRFSDVGGNCGRHRQARAPASLYLHRRGAADPDLR